MEEADWNGLRVAVSARLVPRFAWQTASIDLVIGEQLVMRTGGVFKFVGQVVGSFDAIRPAALFRSSQDADKGPETDGSGHAPSNSRDLPRNLGNEPGI